jgi:hypothetical protein
MGPNWGGNLNILLSDFSGPLLFEVVLETLHVAGR